MKKASERVYKWISEQYPVIESKKVFEKKLSQDSISIEKNACEIYEIVRLHALTSRDYGTCAFVWLRTNNLKDALNLIYKYF